MILAKKKTSFVLAAILSGQVRFCQKIFGQNKKFGKNVFEHVFRSRHRCLRIYAHEFLRANLCVRVLLVRLYTHEFTGENLR